MSTSTRPEGITHPSIDALLEKTDSKYSLVIYASKRARQINAYYSQLGEGLLEYVGPLVETHVQEKPLSIDLREITPEIPVTTNFMGAFPWLDYRAWAQELDVIADDSYPDPADPAAAHGIAWQGDEVTLPSGCGIVGGSAFDHEWRELRLKREAVLRLLGL